MMADKKKKLNAKQKLWLESYLSNGFNATQAAIDAGYKAKTNGVFRNIGYENRTKPHIQERIQERLEEAAMGANEVLARLSASAQGVDIINYIEQRERYAINKAGQEYFAGYDIEVDFKRLQADGFGHLIKKIRPTAQGTVVELIDPIQYLITLAKHHKLLTDKLDLGGDLAITTSTPDAVKALQEARKEMGGG